MKPLCEWTNHLHRGFLLLLKIFQRPQDAQPSPKRWKRARDQEKTVPRTPQRKTAAKEKSAAAEKRMRKALEALGIEVDVMRRCDV